MAEILEQLARTINPLSMNPSEVSALSLPDQGTSCPSVLANVELSFPSRDESVTVTLI